MTKQNAYAIINASNEGILNMEKTDPALSSTQTTKTSEGGDGEVSENQEHTEGFHAHLGDIANFASLPNSGKEGDVDGLGEPTGHEARYDEEDDPNKDNNGDDIPPESAGPNSWDNSSESESGRIAVVRTHQVGYICAKQFLPREQAQQIGNGLRRIDQRNDEETIEALTRKGALPPSFKLTENNLIANGISPNLLTVAEAEQLNDYVGDKTPEIVKAKVEEIINSIHRMRNTSKSRRDFGESSRADKFDRLAKLADDYENGEFDDREGNFDINRYLIARYSANYYQEIDYPAGRGYGDEYTNHYDGYSRESYYSFFRDTGVMSSLERAIEDGATVEDLLEEYLISDDQIPVMGPFTRQDLEDIEVFQEALWAEPDARTNSGTKKLLSVTVPGVGLNAQLTARYVAEQFLPNRRLGPKDLLCLTASTGLSFLESESNIPEDDAREIKEKLSRASFYLGKAMLVSNKTLQEIYGSTRPVTEEFFKEVIQYANGLSRDRELILTSDINAYLQKLHEWLFEVEALYEPYVIKRIGGESGDSGPKRFGLPNKLTLDKEE